MTSREVVKRAVNFQKPDRLPCEFSCYDRNDVTSLCYVGGVGDRSKRYDTDHWGCGWSRSEVQNMGLVTYHPLSDWDNLKDFSFPDPHDPNFLITAENRVKTAGDKYRKCGIFMLLFERLHALRGFTNTLEDLYLEPEKLGALADRIVEYDIEVIKMLSSKYALEIDGFEFSDDWGTELACFIRPELWDEFFKPRYKKIFDACHQAGWHVWMHSCGKINELIPSLIEIGVNVLNLQQPRALGIEEIGRRFAGKVCFSSLCDIQHTLPFESDEKIREEAALILKHWATPSGGFVFSDYGDDSAIGTKPGKKQVMFDAFMEFDPFINRS